MRYAASMGQNNKLTTEQWERIIARWRASGKTAEEFGRQEGLSARSVLWWSWWLGKGRAARQARTRGPTAAEQKGSSVTEASAIEACAVGMIPVRVRMNEPGAVESSKSSQGGGKVEIVLRGNRIVRAGSDCDLQWLGHLVEVLERGPLQC